MQIRFVTVEKISTVQFPGKRVSMHSLVQCIYHIKGSACTQKCSASSKEMGQHALSSTVQFPGKKVSMHSLVQCTYHIKGSACTQKISASSKEMGQHALCSTYKRVSMHFEHDRLQD